MSLEQQIIDLTRQVNRIEQAIDNLVKPEVGGIWFDWTPTLTQGAAVTFTNVYSRYTTKNNLVVVQMRLTPTSNGTAANAIEIGGIPSAVQCANFGTINIIGSGMVRDPATAQYGGIVEAITATGWRFRQPGVNGYVGVAPAVTLANTWQVSLDVVYER